MNLIKKMGLIVVSTITCVACASLASADDVKIPAKADTPYYDCTYDGSFEVAWQDDDSVDGYEFEYSYADGKNKKVKDLGFTQLAEIEPARNKFYRCRIRAYAKDDNGKKYYGAWSNYCYCAKDMSHHDLETEGSVVRKKKKKINRLKLTWNKIKGAKKYVVYMSTSMDTGYKKVKTVKKSKNTCTVTKFRKKKLKRGRTYYVRICAVVKIGNSTYRTPMKDSVQGYISIY